MLANCNDSQAWIHKGSASVHFFITCHFSAWTFCNLRPRHHTRTHAQVLKLKTDLHECCVFGLSYTRSCCAFAHGLYAVSFATLIRCQFFPDALALWCGLVKSQCRSSSANHKQRARAQSSRHFRVFAASRCHRRSEIWGFLHDLFREIKYLLSDHHLTTSFCWLP